MLQNFEMKLDKKNKKKTAVSVFKKALRYCLNGLQSDMEYATQLQKKLM